MFSEEAGKCEQRYLFSLKYLVITQHRFDGCVDNRVPRVWKSGVHIPGRPNM